MSEEQGKTLKKTRIAIPTEPLKSLEKKGKRTKKKEILTERRNKESTTKKKQKTRKGRTRRQWGESNLHIFVGCLTAFWGP